MGIHLHPQTSAFPETEGTFTSSMQLFLQVTHFIQQNFSAKHL